MPAAARRMLGASALLLALATLLGAAGAHMLRGRLSVDRYEILQTAVHYQFFHSLGLLAIGVLAARNASRLLNTAGTVLTAGIVLFCGSLYALVAGAPKIIGAITPLGGLCLIAAWLLVAVAAWRMRALANS